MYFAIGRALVIIVLSVEFLFVHVSADEDDNNVIDESSFYIMVPDGDESFYFNIYEAGMRELQMSLRKFALKMDSVERVGNLITLYTKVDRVGDVIRYRELQQLSEDQEKSLAAMKDDSRLLEYLLRYKILTVLMDNAEKFKDDLDVVKSSDLKWIPGKINDLRNLLNDLKNEIWWLRKVNVMEFVQNIHKRLMKILIMTENISEISSSAVIENILSKIRNFVQNQVNAFLDAAY